MSELGRIRQGVIDAGRALRDGWPPPSDGQFAAGATVVLVGVDPTHQAPHQAGRAIIHRARRARSSERERAPPSSSACAMGTTGARRGARAGAPRAAECSRVSD